MANKLSPLFSTSTESSRRASEETSSPSVVLSVHDHVLPKGWQCKRDPRTNKYYFSREDKFGYEFGSSSSSSSPSHVCCGHRHHMAFTTTRYRTSEFSVERITKLFPEVDESHVTYLLRIYHNHEETVVKTLLGEGCRVHGTTAIDEGLFYKLRNNFPHINPDTIRLLLAKNENREHETITAILGRQTSRVFDRHYRPSSPKLKLRYLKILFPDVDEDKLFDLLYNSGHDAREVIVTLEGLGYKMIDRVAQMHEEEKHHEEAGKSVKDIAVRPTSIKLQYPKAFSERDKYKRQLAQEFPDVTPTLIEMALDSSNQNQEQARLFLQAMTPQDSNKYMPRPKSPKPQVLKYPCIATQTGVLVDTVSEVPLLIEQKDDVPSERKDVSTWTKEDGIIEMPGKRSLAKGSDSSLRIGSRVERTQLLTRVSPVLSNYTGSSKDWTGSTITRITRISSKGADVSLRKGSEVSLRIKKPIINPIDIDI